MQGRDSRPLGNRVAARRSSGALDAQMILLRPSTREELELFVEFEAEEDTCKFINQNSLAEHSRWFDDDRIRYLTILKDDKAVGFFILCLEDGAVEFRRVVVAASSRGIGQDAIRSMHSFCVHELGVSRIWLDVYEHNERGRHIYSKLGYKVTGSAEHDGKRLLVMEKRIQQYNAADAIGAADF